MGQLFLVLIVLSAVFALIQVFRIKDTFSRIINAVLAIGIGVSLIPQVAIAIDGYYLFAMGCLLVVLYAFSDSDFSDQKKGIIIGMGGIQLVSMLFFLMRWPNAEMAYMMCILTVVAYIFVVAKDIQSYKNEIGFMTVLMVDALIKSSMVLLASGT